jgi:hypothetical protein
MSSSSFGKARSKMFFVGRIRADLSIGEQKANNQEPPFFLLLLCVSVVGFGLSARIRANLRQSVPK